MLNTLEWLIVSASDVILFPRHKSRHACHLKTAGSECWWSGPTRCDPRGQSEGWLFMFGAYMLTGFPTLLPSFITEHSRGWFFAILRGHHWVWSVCGWQSRSFPASTGQAPRLWWPRNNTCVPSVPLHQMDAVVWRSILAINKAVAFPTETLTNDVVLNINWFRISLNLTSIGRL